MKAGDALERKLSDVVEALVRHPRNQAVFEEGRAYRASNILTYAFQYLISPRTLDLESRLTLFFYQMTWMNSMLKPASIIPRCRRRSKN